MKKIIFLIPALFSVSTLFAQQISLFNSGGDPLAYIDYDQQATIYMWDGKPVAFIEQEGNDACVIGFNGNFLGWYENGVIYDKKGYAVGARDGAANMITKIEPMKGMQKITPIRPVTPISPLQPIWKIGWGKTSLTAFLSGGIK